MSDPDERSTGGDPVAGLKRGVQRRIERQVASTTGGKAAAYQGAFEAVLAILIAMGIGFWADKKLGSAPIGMLLGVVLGFAAFVVRLLRLRRLQEPSGDGAGAGSETSESDRGSRS